jgi:hypothetical protein
MPLDFEMIMTNHQNRANVKGELDRLAAEFFRAVSFEPGETPPYETIYTLFIEPGLLIKNSAVAPEVSTVSQFLAPRQALVAAGELSRFHESELFETTEIFGKVAHRFSAYAKSGTLKGIPFEARGMCSTQFILTPAGWKMSVMAWDDERPGLSIPDPIGTRADGATA